MKLGRIEGRLVLNEAWGCDNVKAFFLNTISQSWKVLIYQASIYISKTHLIQSTTKLYNLFTDSHYTALQQYKDSFLKFHQSQTKKPTLVTEPAHVKKLNNPITFIHDKGY